MGRGCILSGLIRHFRSLAYPRKGIKRDRRGKGRGMGYLESPRHRTLSGGPPPFGKGGFSALAGSSPLQRPPCQRGLAPPQAVTGGFRPPPDRKGPPPQGADEGAGRQFLGQGGLFGAGWSVSAPKAPLPKGAGTAAGGDWGILPPLTEKARPRRERMRGRAGSS